MTHSEVEEMLQRIEPFVLDEPVVKRQITEMLVASWRRGFKKGRMEGRLDQHMLGGES